MKNIERFVTFQKKIFITLRNIKDFDGNNRILVLIYFWTQTIWFLRLLSTYLLEI
jgi:hypothetical protein